ncbi:M3 family oligoendopeptidase [Thermanaerothrix sp.]|uniref:M3 family oligoendopeptidase n=1 Tax=Thermanaerothrix sp. TaxID=2972675 RepID=UPI003C7A03D3
MTDAVFTQTRWSLDDLFPGPQSPELEAAFQQLETQTAALEALRPTLRDDLPESEFQAILDRIERLHDLASRLYGYANLLFSEDTRNTTAQTLVARVEQFLAELANRTLFFELWWKALPDAAAERLLAVSGDRRYWLETLRRFRSHTLSEPEEKIINLKNVTGSSALQRLYESITSRYVFKLIVDGEEKALTRDALMTYARGPNPDLRAAAYRELYRVYGEEAPILAQIYQAIVRDWYNEQVTLRKHPSPISARNKMNDLPDEVVDTLLEVCRANTEVFRRFFRLKARWLGVDRLRRYDIYAPVTQADKLYPFEQAAWLVLDSFEAFEPRIARLAQRVFEQKHLDSEIRHGKRGGAFCWSAVPGLTPWVLTNYNGRTHDVATLAHELGHAIHSMLAEHHSVLTFHATLPLAETASTFGEMLLVDRLLNEEPDEAVRADLLFRQMDDAYGTIQRQAFFALFERQAHEMIRQDAALEDLAAAYLENLRAQFGDAVELSEEFKWEWVSIPHFYEAPFYVYAYAFGQLLVLSLYQQYRREGASFRPRYLRILEAGGAKAPIQILNEAGVDVTQAAFWQGGFDVLSDLVAQLEALPLPA